MAQLHPNKRAVSECMGQEFLLLSHRRIYCMLQYAESLKKQSDNVYVVSFLVVY